MKILFTILLTLATGLGGAAAGIEYTAKEVGPAGSAGTAAFGVNNQGVVAGYAFLAGVATGFTDNGAATLLAPLPGYRQSYGQAINDRGQVAGYCIDVGGFIQACVWTDGVPLNIGPITPGGRTTGYGINAAGDLVGTGETTVGGAEQAFLFTNGAMAPLALGTLGGSQSFGEAVNGAGTVVGWAELASGQRRAFSFRRGSPMKNLGTLGGTESRAHDINEAGVIVGESRIGGGSLTRAFRLVPGGMMTSLGIAAGGTFSVASAINAAGEIVGNADGVGSTGFGFHWWNGRLRNLNTLVSIPGYNLERAIGINNAGQICVNGRAGGVSRSFLLTPIPPKVRVSGSRNLTTRRAQQTLRGSTTGAVLAVNLRVGSRSVVGVGTERWRGTVRLRPGVNRVVVTARGPGRTSPPVRLRITRR